LNFYRLLAKEHHAKVLKLVQGVYLLALRLQSIQKSVDVVCVNSLAMIVEALSVWPDFVKTAKNLD
jgi:hypothetical protein